MSLDTERERLDVAEEYLKNYPASSQEFDAALEHVQRTYKDKPELRGYCIQVVRNASTYAVKAREHGKLKALGDYANGK